MHIKRAAPRQFRLLLLVDAVYPLREHRNALPAVPPAVVGCDRALNAEIAWSLDPRIKLTMSEPSRSECAGERN